MGHLFLSLIFVPCVFYWLAYELRPGRFSPWKHWPWLVAIAVLQPMSSVISVLYGGTLGNFLLHSIGGGMAGTCMFFYFVRTFDFKLNWRFQLLALFMFTSAVGVLNELAEYAAELRHVLIFSLDTHDTWRDLVANTSGSLLAWAVIRAYLKLISNRGD